MNQEQVPIPSLGRMMVFADGENLVLRYQAMVDEGRVPSDNVAYEKDIYVWRSHTVRPGLNQVIRATYYTYAFGDKDRLREINESIKNLEFEQYSDPHARMATRHLQRNLYPRVFQKIRGKKAKGVDIQLTVDILTNVYMDNLDSISNIRRW